VLQVKTGTGSFPLAFPPGYRDITDERLATQFLEEARWGGSPSCVRCGSKEVKRIMDAKTGERDKRMYWRCHGCYRRFSVRSGTMMESARFPIHHWLRLLHLLDSNRALGAKEVQAVCHISPQNCSYVMQRIRSGVFLAGEAWRAGAITVS
jgi:transposase-like protein